MGSGVSKGKAKRVFIYNICEHEAAFLEVEAQAISYTTGVPAVTAAMLYMQGHWNKPGVWNLEQLNPAPFLALVAELGLPWHVVELDASETLPVTVSPTTAARDIA